jgi:hypothetical protein
MVNVWNSNGSLGMGGRHNEVRTKSEKRELKKINGRKRRKKKMQEN